MSFRIITLTGMLLGMFSFSSINAQVEDPMAFDYKEVDQYVKSLSGSNFLHVRDLTDQLTLDFKTEAEKSRAIFKWIADNIGYDCNAEKKSDDLKSKDRNKWKEWNEERDRYFLRRVFKEREGAYDDHARFFKAMCDSAGITSRVIQGFGRNDENRIGKRAPKRPNHWWNAVRLNEKWYLLDVMWAAGDIDCEEKGPGFTRDYKDGFYLVPPHRFVMNHLAEEAGWQMVQDAQDRLDPETFFLTPQVWEGYFAAGIDRVSPNMGLLEIPIDTLLIFEFTASNPLDSVKLIRTFKVDDEYTTEELESTTFAQSGDNIYTLPFSPPEKGRRFFLTFMIKDRAVLTYKVIASKTDSY